jgi:hypothetical protein
LRLQSPTFQQKKEEYRMRQLSKKKTVIVGVLAVLMAISLVSLVASVQACPNTGVYVGEHFRYREITTNNPGPTPNGTIVVTITGIHTSATSYNLTLGMVETLDNGTVWTYGGYMDYVYLNSHTLWTDSGTSYSGNMMVATVDGFSLMPPDLHGTYTVITAPENGGFTYTMKVRSIWGTDFTIINLQLAPGNNLCLSQCWFQDSGVLIANHYVFSSPPPTGKWTVTYVLFG